ncbi:MAG: histidine kinase [Myxococcales bacterium]
MEKVGDILEKKGRTVYHVSPDHTVFEAIALMSEHHIGAVLVMQSQQLVGILTERDYARKVILQGRSSRETPVRDVMTPRVLYVHPEDSITGCMALMTDKRVRHLPVLVEGRVVGIVSIGDVVKARMDDLSYTVRILESYIMGAYPG